MACSSQAVSGIVRNLGHRGAARIADQKEGHDQRIMTAPPGASNIKRVYYSRPNLNRTPADKRRPF